MSFGQLKEEYEMSQMEIAEKLFLNVQTVRSTEKRAMEKLKKALAERGFTLEDWLEGCK
jgi:DNA-directed RNA polymerase specialized sigma24 family protein